LRRDEWEKNSYPLVLGQDRQVTLWISNWGNCPIGWPESGKMYGQVLFLSIPFFLHVTACTVWSGDFAVDVDVVILKGKNG